MFFHRTHLPQNGFLHNLCVLSQGTLEMTKKTSLPALLCGATFTLLSLLDGGRDLWDLIVLPPILLPVEIDYSVLLQEQISSLSMLGFRLCHSNMVSSPRFGKISKDPLILMGEQFCY